MPSKSESQRFAWVLAALCLAFTAPAMADTDPDAPVAAAAAHFLRVFDDLDFEAFRACWAADASVFFPFDDTPERVTGTDAVLARFGRFFAETRARGDGPPYLHLAPRDLRIDRHGDAAIVTFMLDGPGPRVGRRTLVFVREQGAWKLAHLHASNMVPAASP